MLPYLASFSKAHSFSLYFLPNATEMVVGAETVLKNKGDTFKRE